MKTNDITPSGTAFPQFSNRHPSAVTALEKITKARCMTLASVPRRAWLASIVGLAVGLLTAGTALANNSTWSGAAANASFNNAGNWNALPVSGDSLVFTSVNGAGTSTLSDNLMTPATYSIGGITFGSDVNWSTWIVQGNSSNGFTLTGDIVNNASTDVLIKEAIVVNGNSAITTTSGRTTNLFGGSLTGTGNLTIGGAGTLKVGSYFATAPTVSLSGASSVITVQNGATLRTANTSTAAGWSGNTANLQIDSGGSVLMWDAGTNLAVGALTGSGAVNGRSTAPLIIGQGDKSGTFSGTLNDYFGSLNITKTGAGTQTFSAVTFNNSGPITIDGGKLLIQNSTYSSGFGAKFVANADLEFNITNTVEFNRVGGSITGTGNLIKSGSGEFRISGAFSAPQTFSLTGATRRRQ